MGGRGPGVVSSAVSSPHGGGGRDYSESSAPRRLNDGICIRMWHVGVWVVQVVAWWFLVRRTEPNPARQPGQPAACSVFGFRFGDRNEFGATKRAVGWPAIYTSYFERNEITRFPQPAKQQEHMLLLLLSQQEYSTCSKVRRTAAVVVPHRVDAHFISLFPCFSNSQLN